MTTDSVGAYFRWLRGQVDGLSPDHDIFFNTLWSRDYEFVLENDVNRAEDGLGMRDLYEALHAVSLPYLGECKVLEFLVALAKRIEEVQYDWEGPNMTASWFWLMIENLGIEAVTNDVLFALGTGEIHHILDRFMSNCYNPDGTEGGLFPMKDAGVNLQNVEIWYQMQMYNFE